MVHPENEIVLATMKFDNPWWEGRQISVHDFHRGDYHTLMSALNQPSVQVIVGPRRVGKTEMLRQVVQSKISLGMDPKRIFFLSLERPAYDLLDPARIIHAVTIYEKEILGGEIGTTGTDLLVIDEAQYDATWARYVKQLMDQRRTVLVIVTGSSSAAIAKGVEESGAGRFTYRRMLGMKYRDVLRIRNSAQSELITSYSVNLRSAFEKAVTKKDPNIYFRELMSTELKLSELKISPSDVFSEYLLKGGYPEFYLSEKSWAEISDYYQKNVFELIVSRDLMNVFKFKNSQRIRSILIYLLQHSSEVLSRSTIADAMSLTGRLDSKERIVDDHVDALIRSHLIRVSARYNGLQGRPSTSEKKFYAGDVGFRNCFLGIQSMSSDMPDYPKLLETAAEDHAERLRYRFSPVLRTKGYYWRAKRGKEFEVDIMLDCRPKFKFMIPIEVKSGQIDGYERSRLRETARSSAAPFSIGLTKDNLQLDDGVLSIPAWLFFLTA